MSAEEEREKKSGGVAPSWLGGTARVGSMVRGGGAVGGRLGALRGLLSGRVAAVFGSKLGAAAIIGTALVISTYGLFDMDRRGGFGVEAPRKVSGFHSSYNPDSAAALSAPAAASSGLDFAQRANRGLFSGPSASADSAPGGGAAQDAPGAVSADAPPPDAAAGVPPDPAALAAAAGSGKALPNAGYGKFSSGGGGLGGGGAWGGVGQSFQQPKLSNTQLAQARAFSPGAKAKVSRGMTPAGNLGRSALKGASAQRLDKMNRAMAATRKGSAEAASAAQTQQWTNAAPTGNSVQGAGVGGAGTGGQEAEGGGLGEGGPLGSASPTPSSQVPSTGDGKNVTPYQGLVDMATIMLMAASLLLLISYLLGKTKWGYKYAKYVAYAAMACAAITTLMGIAIMAQGGQTMQGLVFTGVGALLTFLSYTAAEQNPEAANAQPAAEQAAVETTAGDPAASRALSIEPKGADATSVQFDQVDPETGIIQNDTLC